MEKAKKLACCKNDQKSDAESPKSSHEVQQKSPIRKQDFVYDTVATVQRVELEQPIIEEPVRKLTPPVDIVKPQLVHQAGVIINSILSLA